MTTTYTIDPPPQPGGTIDYPPFSFEIPDAVVVAPQPFWETTGGMVALGLILALVIICITMTRFRAHESREVLAKRHIELSQARRECGVCKAVYDPLEELEKKT